MIAKLKLHCFLPLVVVLAGASSSQVHAQILVFQSPDAITLNSPTSTSDILMNGTYVDAVTAGTPDTIGDMTFNQVNSGNGYSDGTISFSNVDGIGGDGIFPLTTGNTDYDNILNQCVYTTGTGTVTLSNLVVSQYYQVQVWKARDNPPSRDTLIGTQDLDGAQHTVATFQATGTTATFDFGPASGATYGEINAISLREVTVVPELSTWIMMFTGAFALAWGRKRKCMKM